MKNTTLDGYKYLLIYRQPTTMNTMCVYRILKANEDPVYFLASGELSEWFISRSTFNEMKSHILPQHYEGFFKDEFTAILMAEVTEKLVKLQSCISWENCDAFEQYYDSQDELREAAINRERENKNND